MVRHAAPIRNRAASDLNDISDFRRMTKHLGLIEAPLQKRRGLRRHACEPFPIRLRPRENRHDSGGGDRPARQGSGRSCRNDRRLTAVAHRPGSVAESPRLRAQDSRGHRDPALANPGTTCHRKRSMVLAWHAQPACATERRALLGPPPFLSINSTPAASSTCHPIRVGRTKPEAAS
jgi:hypothetical protein